MDVRAANEWRMTTANVVAGIDWKEPVVVFAVSFHLVLLLLLCLTRESDVANALFFVLLSIVGLSCKRLNDYAARDWPRFARKPYFDSGGLFVSVLVGLPAIINMVLLTLLILRKGTRLLARVLLLQHEKRD